MNRVFTGVLASLLFLVVSVSSVVALTPSYSAGNASETIKYDLPYPGILPDSPLYFVKVVRDRLVSFLIQSPVNKGFYALLLSDKRLAAGQVLIDTGKANLGATTIANGEEYFLEAVSQAEEAKKQKKDVTDLVAKLTVAGAKHEEVISMLLPKVSGVDADRLNKAYEDNQKSRNRVQGLMKKS